MSRGVLGEEFSHLVEVERIGPEGALIQLTANAEQLAALARQLQIPAVLQLEAQIRLVPDPAQASYFLLKGQFEAEVEQTCVVSLEPVRQRVAEPLFRRFAPGTEGSAGGELDEEEAEWLDPDAEDPPDPLLNGTVDVGAVVAEALALALDPYPRKSGAAWPEGYVPPPESGGNVSPFAALAKLKAGQKD